MSKIRIYDLAKELKLDNKKVMDDVRRFGYDVRVASNSIPDDIAEKVRNQYFAKRTAPPPPTTVKLVKAPHHPPAETPAAPPPSIALPPSLPGPKLIKKPTETARPGDYLPEAAGAAAPQPATTAEETPAPMPSGEPTTRIVRIEAPPPPPPPVEPVVSRPETPVAPSLPTIHQIPTPPPAVQVEAPPPPPPSSGPQVFTLRPLPTPPPAPPRPPVQTVTPREDGRRGYQTTSAPTGGQPDRRMTPPRPAATQPPPAAGAGAPQRTTYIPPKDQKRGKGRNVKGRGGATGRREHHERDISPSRGGAPALAPYQRNYAEFKAIKVTEGTTVKELAEKFEVKPKDVVAYLFAKGIMATINQTLTEETMRDIGKAFGFDVTVAGFEEMVAEQEFIDETAAGEDEIKRAPVVTVMGHVDHGKTSLLDAIRNTRVAAGEAGGITQHIGAYCVDVPDPDDPEVKRKIVFLDTPGHEAFTMMRARGAKATDVAIIVVAADDGVMPQTVEAIDHARAAQVPIVVAINKIDKPDANTDRVKQQLADHGLLWDGWGGDTVMVEISAKKRHNLEGLLEMVLLSSDLLTLKANPKRMASGVVLEARLDKGRGPVASVLVQQGTLRVGDPIIAGFNFGRVRALFDDLGRGIQEAGPAVPVEVLGLQGVPKAGDLVQVVKDAVKGQEMAEWRQSKHRIAQLSSTSARGLEDVFERMRSGSLKELLVILKADVQGSVEVLRDTLEKLSTEKVGVRVIRSDVGAITESDVLLASASNDMAHTSVIIGFNVRPAPRVADLAKQEKVDIRLHNIIYKVEEEMRKAMIGLLDPTTREVVLGRADVRQVIKIPRVGNVAGCQVSDGVFKRAARVRVLRDNAIVFEGDIASLRRFKDDVSEVKTGFECGIGIERFNDVKPGDVLECFTVEKVAATEL